MLAGVIVVKLGEPSDSAAESLTVEPLPVVPRDDSLEPVAA